MSVRVPGSRCTAAGACALAAVAFVGCEREEKVFPVAGADAETGKLLLRQYDCGSCHLIPGVPGARGVVGPALATFPRHVYIAGELPNEPHTLIRWLQDPPALVPGTAMPDLGVTAEHARDMAAYLYGIEP